MTQWLAERRRVVRDAARNFRENRRFRAAHPDFPTPPYALAFDAYAHTSWPGYVRHGVEHAELVAEKIRKHRASDSGAQRLTILDWGCGPGRVIRQIRDRLRPLEVELYGTDYNPAAIRWCRANLTDIRFERNDASPPLPFPDAHFGVIYAISVFTHLCEAQHFAWRDELARLLAPGGLLLITLHGERFLRYLDAEDQARFRSGQLAVREFAAEGKRDFQAYHPKAWVEANFAGPFECLECDERELSDWFHQDVWVLRKSTDASDPTQPQTGANTGRS